MLKRLIHVQRVYRGAIVFVAFKSLSLMTRLFLLLPSLLLFCCIFKNEFKDSFLFLEA